VVDDVSIEAHADDLDKDLTICRPASSICTLPVADGVTDPWNEVELAERNAKVFSHLLAVRGGWAATGKRIGCEQTVDSGPEVPSPPIVIAARAGGHDSVIRNVGGALPKRIDGVNAQLEGGFPSS